MKNQTYFKCFVLIFEACKNAEILSFWQNVGTVYFL